MFFKVYSGTVALPIPLIMSILSLCQEQQWKTISGCWQADISMSSCDGEAPTCYRFVFLLDCQWTCTRTVSAIVFATSVQPSVDGPSIVCVKLSQTVLRLWLNLSHSVSERREEEEINIIGKLLCFRMIAFLLFHKCSFEKYAVCLLIRSSFCSSCDGPCYEEVARSHSFIVLWLFAPCWHSFLNYRAAPLKPSWRKRNNKQQNRFPIFAFPLKRDTNYRMGHGWIGQLQK